MLRILTFIVVFVLVFSPLTNVVSPYLPKKLAEVFYTQTAYAFTSGPNTSSSVTEAGVTGCTNNATVWDTTASTYANDDTAVGVYGSVSNWDAGETTDEIRFADFGFSITGTVTGITVEVLGWESQAGTANYTDVILFTAPGTEVGTDKATGSLPASDPGTTYQTFGGSADTWTAGLTAAQVSNTGFGVVLCWTAGAANSQVTLDHVRMTITYTNSAPTITVDQPDGVGDTVTAGDSYNIQYDLADTDNTVTAAFFYDTDGSGLDGTPISGACATAAEGTNVTCSWDTTGVTPGTYFVYGTTNDGVNAAVSAYSSGQITIDAPAAGDLSWDTGASDFEIWAGATTTTDASLTWDNGTLICSTSLNDDNTRQSTCGAINKNQKYRIQTVLKNVGGAAFNMNGAGDPVDQKNVKTFWAGTSPTLDTCGFNDLGADNGATTCNLAFNGNDVRITNTGAGNVVIAATTGTEGFMYLLTTDSNVSLSDSSTYMNASIDSVTEDSSRITIGQKRRTGLFIRGKTTIRGRVTFR